jgi:hypothetical protein
MCIASLPQPSISLVLSKDNSSIEYKTIKFRGLFAGKK